MTTVRTLPATSRRQEGPWLTVASLAIAGLVALASLLGLFADWPYQFETENWALQARGQDVGNLLAVVVLLVATIRMRAGSVRAVQVWVGAQFYLLYAYLVYAFALHLGRLFLVYVAVLGLIAFSLIASLPAALRVPATGRVRARRFGGAVLIGTGALFALLWLACFLIACPPEGWPGVGAPSAAALALLTLAVAGALAGRRVLGGDARTTRTAPDLRG